MKQPSLRRNLWVDYLRSAITVLVVAHHSSLAYTTFAQFDPKAYINSTHPIVDVNRWIGLDIFENFNDVFFMSLMFLIGGLFLMRSISKKGASHFVRDRFYRLFIPFLFLGTFFMLIAYFPSYYVAHQNTDIFAYIRDFFTVEKWPVGPPWFIWVLFLFNFLFALLSSVYHRISRKANACLPLLGNQPVKFFFATALITWILYVPMAYLFGSGTWTGIGPFDFQVSRILLYFGYFSLGVLIGNTDFNNKLFAEESLIVRNWWIWPLLALSVYALLTLIGSPLTQLVKEHRMSEFNGYLIYYTVYVTSCASSSIAFIILFRKFMNIENKWWSSLSANAYMIYLIHFIFVIWGQFFLLKIELPAILKFLITFMVAMSLSWMSSILLRKIKIIRQYI
jgi:glucans biosynthesis protein C